MPRTLFHASPAALAPGAELVPGNRIGRRNFKHGDVSNTHVFTAPTVDLSRVWARLIADDRGEPVHVYEVSAPAARRRADDEYRSPTATVLRHVETVLPA